MSIFDIRKFNICPSWSYIYQDYQSCISLIKVCSTIASRDLLQDTVEYNRKINLTRKMLKLKRCPLPTLPLSLVGPIQPVVSANVPVESGKVVGRCLWAKRRVASSEVNDRPVQPGVSVDVPVESNKVIEGRVAPSKANNRLLMSKTPKKTKHVCNHVLYTPMAELRRNYETVLSWLQPAAIKVSKGNIRQKSRQSRSAPESSELPSTRYRVPSDFVDELLDGLVISDRTTEYQSSLRSAPDLSDLPSTKYRVPSSFIDKMLDSPVISDGALEGYTPSMTFVDNFLDSL